MSNTNKKTNSSQQNYSWKGSWDAGTALMILVGGLTVLLFVAGFAY
ncbi:MAG: hypothetical protein AAGJ95_03350 [Cyanobacteria bacterium J06554_11]